MPENQPELVQAIPANVCRGRVPRSATSRKAPAVKHTVALLRAQGHSKSEIAREVGIDRETNHGTKERTTPRTVSQVIEKMVDVTGIEPATPCLQSRCSPS